jgi:S1-C subfamily serine protease
MKYAALSLLLASFSWVGVVERVERSVVPLQIKNASQQLVTICTAVVVAAQTLLTEEHCIMPKKETFADAIPVTPVHVEKELVILKATGRQREWKSIEIRREPLRRGESIAVVGYGFSLYMPLVTVGVVAVREDPAVLVRLRDEGDLFDVTAVRGQSGGAIVDSRGRLVSLVRSVIPDDPTLPSLLTLGIRNQELNRIWDTFVRLDK